jgi:glycosyltransferase involved in cell wall biosynthesis
MKISFYLLGASLHPIGGCKIVFEYANRLKQRGHDVSIIFDCSKTFKKYKLPELIRKPFCSYLVKKNPKWFQLDKNIKKVFMADSNYSLIPDGDIIVSTAVETADIVLNLNKSKGGKFYLIQDFENWNMTDEEVFTTYGYNMNNIVISKWLKKIVDEKSKNPSIYIPNAIDFNIFGVDIPIDNRTTHSIAMLFHNGEHKGVKYGLEAIYALKKNYQDLEVTLFGVPKRPNYLPKWIDYVRSATQEDLRKIYNKSTIFLCPSINEGFGLTGAESMACGCALVSTAYKGVLEYAENGNNALLSPIKDVNSMVKNAIKLFDDNAYRVKLALEGENSIKKLSWDNTIKAFELAVDAYLDKDNG